MNEVHYTAAETRSEDDSLSRVPFLTFLALLYNHFLPGRLGTA